MKKTGSKASAYWQEVSQLFTRAGAFGIVNLFDQPPAISRSYSPTAIRNIQKDIPGLHNKPSLTGNIDIEKKKKML